MRKKINEMQYYLTNNNLYVEMYKIFYAETDFARH